MSTTARSIDRGRLAQLLEAERRRFLETHTRSGELHRRAQRSLLAGVPMNWMTRWAGPHPVFVAEASGARFRDVDGNEYVDLCLGDTGAMTGHSPAPAVAAIAAQAARGITLMLPSEDAIWVGEELQRRFGLPYWQFTLSATDANRFAIRLARGLTGRPKILVYNGCYHGSVDEALVELVDGQVRPRQGSVGPPVDPAQTTRVIEFNDLPALEAALGEGDVACVLAEPALTNIGIVLPEPGYHEHLRRITRETGTVLIIDETHTICAGPGGYTRAHGLEPDMFVIGKPIGSGLPSGTYGFSEQIAERISQTMIADATDVSGVGGTLAGNALALAAIHATLDSVLTDEAFARMIPLAERFSEGVERAIDEHGLPWHVIRLGCRAEYRFQTTPPHDGGEAAAAEDVELSLFTHLFALNRGILLTPFHNMALMSPATTAADVDRHTEVFAATAAALMG